MNQELQSYFDDTSHFHWKCVSFSRSSSLPDVAIAELELTSQLWREGEALGVNQPVWKHRLTVYLPDQQQTATCLLMLMGGVRHNQTMETSPSSSVDAARLCNLTHAPVVTLKDIPNQTLEFGDGKPRSEDDLVAWSWQQYLNDPEGQRLTPLQWPMVRSVIRAMDAVTGFAAQEQRSIDDFYLSGASKRGWVAWLTAAHDYRVMAVVPMVIDVLNVEACIHHHLNVYGKHSPAIDDYAEQDILKHLDSPEMQQLMADIDPYSYRENLFLPKFIINSSCDEFFPADSARFYYHQLSEPCWLRYLPNASHYLGRDHKVNTNEVMASVFGALLNESSIPEMRWHYLDDGGLELLTDTQPKSASVWQCHNPLSRDFRNPTLLEQNICFEQLNIEASSSLPWVYRYAPDIQDSGWIAFFIELTFANGRYPDLVLTSGIRVLPDVYPQP
ncbi:PhoPQ-activated protein PqaA family protein [Endozoicomonas sp. OPT23]|uniref:PhoPQ-activated protein PqaA family protein n=1 Tax=Endozoicomonas sp. OPT23 TaxID=2072845 RepID=UPI0018912BC4|nr:PhoPQ-activated protein PqaA family protein [Endozoicomonas sp. OPT23]